MLRSFTWNHNTFCSITCKTISIFFHFIFPVCRLVAPAGVSNSAPALPHCVAARRGHWPAARGTGRSGSGTWPPLPPPPPPPPWWSRRYAPSLTPYHTGDGWKPIEDCGNELDGFLAASIPQASRVVPLLSRSLSSCLISWFAELVRAKQTWANSLAVDFDGWIFGEQ